MLRTAGEPVEAIARAVVTERNRLKAAYRMDDDPRLVAIMEMRNLRKYGDPLGPTAEGLRNRYADWEAVIAAACRPARLVD